MFLPPTVDTNEEFLEYETLKDVLLVEKFDLLMRSIRVNHKFSDNGLCKMCMQEMNFIIYAKQAACHSKKRYMELLEKQNRDKSR
jgi:hypothetical protein